MARDVHTIGLVVHPSRDIDAALASVRAWAEAHGARLGQVLVPGQDRQVADPVEPDDCAVLLAIGGDGTVLGALDRAGTTGPPVLGIAMGSLGALTSAPASEIRAALDRLAGDDWEARELTGLAIERDGVRVDTAINDVVVVRRGSGQVILAIDVDGDPYARTAGDGVIVATALGSSAYTLAADGPLLAYDHGGMVVTPLADHAGFVPAVVLGGSSIVSITVDGGWLGARVEVDGQIVQDDTGPGEQEQFRLDISVDARRARLLDFDGETRIAGLRRRGVIADSPRLKARDAREAKTAKTPRVSRSW
jgi:NAD+ kinase